MNPPALISTPPYPSTTTAKGWRFEIDTDRIRQSDTWALAGPECRPWLLMLWMCAWEQTPCGTLPADHKLIIARLEMPPKLFARFESVLLRGWQEIDGRLYHPVITARVLNMLETRRKDAVRRGRNRSCPAVVPRDIPVTDAGLTRDNTMTDGTGTGTGTKNKEKTMRGSRLPQDWKLSDSLRAWALQNRPDWNAAIVESEAQSFADYWHSTAGSKGLKLDWDLTWHNWVRKSHTKGPVQVNGHAARVLSPQSAAPEPGSTWSKAMPPAPKRTISVEDFDRIKREAGL